MSVSRWGELPSSLLEQIMRVGPNLQDGKELANDMHCVNKHWRDTVRQRFTILKLDTFHSFYFFKKVNAISQFPNLHTIHLERCIWDEVFDRICQSATLPSNEMEVFREPVNCKLSCPKKLRTLIIEDPDDLEPFLTAFCCCPLERLSLKGGYLSRATFHRMKNLKTLEYLKLDDVIVSSASDFKNFLSVVQPTNLTVVHRRCPAERLQHRLQRHKSYEDARMHRGDICCCIEAELASVALEDPIIGFDLTAVPSKIEFTPYRFQVSIDLPFLRTASPPDETELFDKSFWHVFRVPLLFSRSLDRKRKQLDRLNDLAIYGRFGGDPRHCL